ncbi:MFS transporter [Actinomadura sp. DC4]|uniref:MFS transporter n=1 Tax=Actinomadura sp. DC4 TaxID=3055069 RepID=UPI0025B0AFD9|nr:MFS transporter [Actinomadura sp. DC4]MDN3351559.1 MFS transporter [Actinomadura sp. DC4]
MTLQTELNPPETGHPRRTAILALMSVCATMTVALVAAINLAIPKLSASTLRPSSAELLWIVDAYVLVFACLLIPAGAFGDRHGRRGALLAGLGLFAAGCLVCALSPGVGVLLAGRVVTGVGAALIMPATLSLSIQSFPPTRRPYAVATWTAATGLAGIFGNVGGGLILEYLPWQGLFWAMAPIMLVLLALAVRLAPHSDRHPADLDLTGSALLILSFAALLYGIIEGPELGWASGSVIGGFAVAAVVWAIFTVRALRVEHPLIDPRVFRVARLRAGVIGVGFGFFGLFALFYVNAQFLQYAKGFSPVVTGVAIGPLALGMLVTSRWSVNLADRFGARPLVTAGMVTIAVGLALVSLTGPDTPYLLYALFLVVMSLGMGLCVPTLSTGVIGALPRGQAGLGSGLNGAAREIGSALGVAVLGTILTERFTARTPGGAHSVGEALARAGHSPRAVAAFVDAVAIGYRSAAVVVLLAAVFVAIWFRPANK